MIASPSAIEFVGWIDEVKACMLNNDTVAILPEKSILNFKFRMTPKLYNILPNFALFCIILQNFANSPNFCKINVQKFAKLHQNFAKYTMSLSYRFLIVTIVAG